MPRPPVAPLVSGVIPAATSPPSPSPLPESDAGSPRPNPVPSIGVAQGSGSVRHSASVATAVSHAPRVPAAVALARQQASVMMPELEESSRIYARDLASLRWEDGRARWNPHRRGVCYHCCGNENIKRNICSPCRTRSLPFFLTVVATSPNVYVRAGGYRWCQRNCSTLPKPLSCFTSHTLKKCAKCVAGRKASTMRMKNLKVLNKQGWADIMLGKAGQVVGATPRESTMPHAVAYALTGALTDAGVLWKECRGGSSGPVAKAEQSVVAGNTKTPNKVNPDSKATVNTGPSPKPPTARGRVGAPKSRSKPNPVSSHAQQTPATPSQARARTSAYASAPTPTATPTPSPTPTPTSAPTPIVVPVSKLASISAASSASLQHLKGSKSAPRARNTASARRSGNAAPRQTASLSHAPQPSASPSAASDGTAGPTSSDVPSESSAATTPTSRRTKRKSGSRLPTAAENEHMTSARAGNPENASAAANQGRARPAKRARGRDDPASTGPGLASRRGVAPSALGQPKLSEAAASHAPDGPGMSPIVVGPGSMPYAPPHAGTSTWTVYANPGVPSVPRQPSSGATHMVTPPAALGHSYYVNGRVVAGSPSPVHQRPDPAPVFFADAGASPAASPVSQSRLLQAPHAHPYEPRHSPLMFNNPHEAYPPQISAGFSGGLGASVPGSTAVPGQPAAVSCPTSSGGVPAPCSYILLHRGPDGYMHPGPPVSLSPGTAVMPSGAVVSRPGVHPSSTALVHVSSGANQAVAVPFVGGTHHPGFAASGTYAMTTAPPVSGSTLVAPAPTVPAHLPPGSSFCQPTGGLVSPGSAACPPSSAGPGPLLASPPVTAAAVPAHVPPPSCPTQASQADALSLLTLAFVISEEAEGKNPRSTAGQSASGPAIGVPHAVPPFGNVAANTASAVAAAACNATAHSGTDPTHVHAGNRNATSVRLTSSEMLHALLPPRQKPGRKPLSRSVK